MTDATPNSRAAAISAFLAGLQSGLIGAFAMLLWLGIVAEWQQRNFWIPINLMASVFYGPNAIRSGFAVETVSGLAVYIALYSVLGALFALGLQNRLPRLRTFLLSVVFAIAWYYLSFRLLWKAVMPYVALLHVERSTAIGHVIYGIILGGYPAHLPKAEVPKEEPPADTPGEAGGPVNTEN